MESDKPSVLSRTAKMVVPRLLSLMSAGNVNTLRQFDGEKFSWAQPVKVRGIPNLHRVNEELYRSGQPTETGFHRMEELGIRSCLSFRTHRRDDAAASRSSILCKSRPMFGLAVQDDDIIEALLDIRYRMPRPVLVHCYQGGDRTGLVCACYRIFFDHWTQSAAIAEMTQGGYGYHQIYHPMVEYLKRLDISKISAVLESCAQSFGLHGSIR